MYVIIDYNSGEAYGPYSTEEEGKKARDAYLRDDRGIDDDWSEDEIAEELIWAKEDMPVQRLMSLDNIEQERAQAEITKLEERKRELESQIAEKRSNVSATSV